MPLLVESALRSLVLAALVWLALKLLRVTHPYIGRIAWVSVLGAALCMPMLMQWPTLTLPSPAPQLLSIVSLDSDLAPARRSKFDWQLFGSLLYLSVALTLILRQFLGYTRMRRTLRAAIRIHATWTRGMDVRATHDLRAPVTFASTILLPADYVGWNTIKLQSAMAHERTHVLNYDFWLLALAHAHRAIFWFSPLAWWLPHMLSALGEQLSDDATIGTVGDRSGYAEILLEFAHAAHQTESRSVHGAVGMAREATLAGRIERIMSADALPETVSIPRRMAMATTLASLALGIASCSAEKQGADAAPSTALGIEAEPLLAKVTSPQVPPFTESDVKLPDNATFPRSDPESPLTHAIYPKPSRSAGHEGTVVLQVYVGADGGAENVSIAKSSGFPRLDYAAANEALNWKMQPGTVDGKPQAMWGRFAVTFRLSVDTPARL